MGERCYLDCTGVLIVWDWYCCVDVVEGALVNGFKLFDDDIWVGLGMCDSCCVRFQFCLFGVVGE